MFLKYFASGFLVKMIAGFDDTMTRIPIMGNVTHTKRGRFAFILGIFLAISLVILFSFLFGSAIRNVPYSNYIASALILFLAASIYFDWFIEKPKKQTEKRLVHLKTISKQRFFKLMFIGFLTAFATVLDDMIAYAGLFSTKLSTAPFVIVGIFTATIIQLVTVFYFSEKIMGIKYKKEITSIGLVILAGLLFFRIL